ncbi:gamma-interferon-responsive lysosomal thiol protein isoform X2 [Elaeis guineensis]|uniref:Gamma-interferon-responsive lysosomal thiol protein isoform X2 n=1 Tax=Elaeis guineensis var. tenera TaxID=51953 RepID=A0A6I9S5I2_ELAGV|nr:gamma-interferon-responsive lysosomal thiol protein isoform X2 [Elaeis guineensis]
MASGRLLLVFFLISSSCFASSPVSARKVPLALYYETLCPYCSNFIVNYLAKIFENGLIDIIELDLIPYGNARIGSNDTISCQHGPNECVLNTVEACAITAWPDVSEHFSFIYCVESLVMEHKYLEWESCFSKTGLDSNAVLDCYKSGYGKKDYRNFEAYICKAYDGKLPKSCAGLSLKLSSERKTDNQACYADERTDPSITTENDEMKIEMIIKTSTVTFYKS